MTQDQQVRVQFFCEGKPVPKARPRVTRTGGTYTPRTTVDWEETIAWSAKAAMGHGDPLECPVALELWFYGSRPNADLDNLVKCVLDGMQGVVFVDDRQVKQLFASSWVPLSDPKAGVSVKVTEL